MNPPPPSALDPLDDAVTLRLPHRVRFTRRAFDPANPTLVDVLRRDANSPQTQKLFVVVDQGFVHANPALQQQIRNYHTAHRDALPLLADCRALPGGEAAKNDLSLLEALLSDIHRLGLDRQSYLLVIAGGALLDMAGFAAAVAHRGVRLVRMPTTTLAQCDSGVGVKNSVNMFGKKNFIGTFAVPHAVVNDLNFLDTLSDRDYRAGLSEAVKVALLKSASMFEQIEQAADALAQRDARAADPIWQASAQHHYNHILHAGDPFELTAARPLDFGHWAAHKLEPMSNFELRHGEAVAIGLAVDMHYAALAGLCPQPLADRVTALLARLGFTLTHPAMRDIDALLAGLEEFREHLGGQLTITFVKAPGQPIDVHRIDFALMRQAIEKLLESSHKIASNQAPPS